MNILQPVCVCDSVCSWAQDFVTAFEYWPFEKTAWNWALEGKRCSLHSVICTYAIWLDGGRQQGHKCTYTINTQVVQTIRVLALLVSYSNNCANCVTVCVADWWCTSLVCTDGVRATVSLLPCCWLCYLVQLRLQLNTVILSFMHRTAMPVTRF